MLKKLILGITFLSLAPTVTATIPSDFFKVETELEPRAGIDTFLMLAYNTSEKALTPTRTIPVILSLSAYAKSNELPLSPKKKELAKIFTFAANALLPKVINDGFSKETFLNSLRDLFLNLNFTHQDHSWIEALNGIKFLYLAREVDNVLFDIENECAALEIEGCIEQKTLPENINYFVLPSKEFLLASAASWIIQPLKQFTPEVPCIPVPKELMRSRLLAQQNGRALYDAMPAITLISANVLTIATTLSKAFFKFKNNIISHETIQKLSPELQQRCYDLHYKVLNTGYLLMDIELDKLL